MSDIQTLMRSANPIEDAHTEFGQDDLDALLLLTQQRSGDMDVKEVTTPVTPEKKNNRGWLVAAVAFASVIAVAALALLVSGPSEDAPPATTPTTTPVDVALPTTVPPTTVAEPTISADDEAVLAAFVTALNSGDVEAFRAIFDPAAERVGEWEGDYDDDLNGLAIEAQHKHLRGTSSALEDCVPNGDRVTCTLISEGPVELAIFQVPRREKYNFLIEEELILGISAKCDICSDGAETDGEILDWVARFDPAARSVMGAYHANPGSVEGAALWRDYAPMWREAKTAGTLDEVARAMVSVAAYEQSSNAGDAAAFRAAFDPGAVRFTANTPDLPTSLDKIVEEMQALSARQSVVDLTECVVVDRGVRCVLVVTGPVESAVYGGQISGATTLIVDDDGLILEIRAGQLALDVVAADRFLDWVQLTDPTVYEQLLPPGIREL
ncbi:MAG: hypothetical protein ACR2N7_04020, partial [Acidimicrobiia bacterium]